MWKILKFLRLPFPELLLIAKSAILLVLIRPSLFLFSFKTLLKFIERVKLKSRQANRSSEIGSDRIAWAVIVTSRYIPFAKCLEQALVTQMLFAMYGYNSHLHIGVKKDGPERLKAHAWVESKGDIVIGNLDNLSQYSPLVSFRRQKS